MAQNTDLLQNLLVVGHTLNAKGPLAHRMEGNFRGNHLVDATGQPQPLQPRCCKNESVVKTGIQLLQPGEHVSPNVLERQVGIVVTQLGQAAQRTGANAAALRHGLQTIVLETPIDGQRVGGVFPRRDAKLQAGLSDLGHCRLPGCHQPEGHQQP